MKDKVLILVNGQEFEKTYFETLLCVLKVKCIVCCDGAFNKLVESNLIENFVDDNVLIKVIGDFDSVQSEYQNTYSKVEWIHRASQSICDLEKAMLWCDENKHENIDVYNIAGGRIDYTLLNVSILAKQAKKNNIHIWGNDFEAFFSTNYFKNTNSKYKAGQTISLIPMQDCKNIQSQGLKYELEGVDFSKFDFSVSNVIAQSDFEIKLDKGLILVIVQSKEACT